MEQRLSVVTLGDDDVERTHRFFEEGLGWKASAFGDQDIAVFDTGGCVWPCFAEKRSPMTRLFEMTKRRFRP